jgi:hypothetical protein
MPSGRVANKVKTIYVRVCTTPKVRAYLESLVVKELYGKTAPEVAESLLRERIRDLIKDGALKPLEEDQKHSSFVST